MNLLVSTNVYKPGQLARVIPHLHAFRGQIGVELFPMFDADCYEEELLHCLPEFEGIPVSFHGPYYETEHSAAPGTPEYAHSMDLIRQTLPYCVRLRSQYLVFHHNNIPVTEERREEMIRVSEKTTGKLRSCSSRTRSRWWLRMPVSWTAATCCLTRMRLSSSAGKNIILC